MQNMTMSEISVWADKVKHTKEYYFTRSWHYYDNPESRPPYYCNLQIPTRGVNLITKLSELQDMLFDPKHAQFAFRMIVHMLQDAAQPLHLSGNPGLHTPIVNHHGKTTNLHSYWDIDTIDMLSKEDLIENLTREALEENEVNNCTYQDILDWMARTEKQNCNVVWKPIQEDYHVEASAAVRTLIKEAAVYSNCYLSDILEPRPIFSQNYNSLRL
jgi:hypothetical protein